MMQDDWSYQKISVNLPQEALLRFYKSFIRPHLEYGRIYL